MIGVEVVSAPPEPPKRRPQTFGGAVYLLVLATTILGLVLVVVGVWRAGLTWIGAGLLAGCVTRLVLPERISGMLRVRRKWSDVLMLLVAGVALIVLAVIVPDQPGA